MAPPDVASGGANGNAPAGYGRSCTNCSRAKCRCILRPDGDVCERCHRLGKECHQMISQRKRAVKKASSSRTAQLEEKLDDLVSILRASQHQQSPSPHLNSHPDPSRISSEPHNGPPYSQQPPGQHQSSMPSALDSLATAATASRHHPDPGSAAYNPMSSDSDLLPEPTPAEAEVYLSKFKGWLRNFPLMHIEPSMTASQLREEKPFVWLNVMCITTMSVAQQSTIKERIRRELAQKIIIDHEPSIDILQGLLIFLGFSACNAGPGPRNKPYAILFPKLAVSTACELGLVRSPTEEKYFANCFKPWIGRPPFKVRTMEERRCLLALWFIISGFASFVGKIEPLKWMSHMDECLEVLDCEKAVPYDEILVANVKLQVISEEAHKYMVTEAMGGNSGEAPTFLYRKSLINRLNKLREELASVISANSQLQAFLHGVEVQVYSVGLGTHGISDPARVDMMYACLTSARAWYDTFFGMPTIEVPGVSFGFFIQLSQTQTALYRLTISDDPAWDKSVLRNSADILDLLSRCIVRFEEVDHAYPQKPGGEGEETLFTKAVKIMKMLKANWEPALRQSLWGGMPTPRSLTHSTGPPSTLGSVPATTGSTMEAHATPMVVDPNPTLTEPGSVDFNDITWMTDVFGPWEF